MSWILKALKNYSMLKENLFSISYKYFTKSFNVFFVLLLSCISIIGTYNNFMHLKGQFYNNLNLVNANERKINFEFDCKKLRKGIYIGESSSSWYLHPLDYNYWSVFNKLNSINNNIELTNCSFLLDSNIIKYVSDQRGKINFYNYWKFNNFIQYAINSAKADFTSTDSLLNYIKINKAQLLSNFLIKNKIDFICGDIQGLALVENGIFKYSFQINVEQISNPKLTFKPNKDLILSTTSEIRVIK